MENTRRYKKEQELMLSIVHTFGMKTARDHLGVPQQGRPGPTSWLGQQRKTVRIPSFLLPFDTDVRQLGQTLRR